tara:strand:+ start:1040 stop:1462 length:423 start_codon:yes stop_codon:yes gene_type:complete
MLSRILIVLLIVLSIGYSQELGEWRWATDTNEFTMDKKAHFLGSAGAYFFFRHKNYTVEESIKYSFYLGLGKEVVDALLPWEEYGSWGGDGFSKYDLGYDLAGILLAYTLDEIWKPKENSKWERGFSNGRFSLSYRLHSK